MLKPKYIRVLEALENGAEIKIKGYRVVININSELCIITINETLKKEVLLGYDMSVNAFIKLCEELDDKEIPLRIPKSK